MGEAKTYTGGCHCGNVRYQVTTDLSQVMECNCSICAKVGWLLTMVGPQEFRLLTPEEKLRDYQFGRQRVHHLFCPTCGVRSFCRGTSPDGDPVYAVNVRCLEGADLAALEVTQVDGKSF